MAGQVRDPCDPEGRPRCHQCVCARSSPARAAAAAGAAVTNSEPKSHTPAWLCEGTEIEMQLLQACKGTDRSGTKGTEGRGSPGGAAGLKLCSLPSSLRSGARSGRGAPSPGAGHAQGPHHALVRLPDDAAQTLCWQTGSGETSPGGGSARRETSGDSSGCGPGPAGAQGRGCRGSPGAVLGAAPQCV